MERDLYSLKPATRWVASRLDVHDVLDSTNLRAECLARHGAPEGTLVVADRQTAGRGRLGRSFFSPGGRSLYASLLLRPRMPVDRIHEHVFAAAVAVADSARARLGDGPRIEIKWPNDVLIDGLKTSGINLPAQLDGSRVVSAVLGIGVNVNTAPDEFPPELHGIATSLRCAAGRRFDRVDFAEELLERLEAQIESLRAGGFEPVLDCWRAYFRMQGARVRVGGPGVRVALEGVVAGVGPDGALLLSVSGDKGVRNERVLAGDVSLVEPAAEG